VQKTPSAGAWSNRLATSLVLEKTCLRVNVCRSWTYAAQAARLDPALPRRPPPLPR
jgi:hypothetical protein